MVWLGDTAEAAACCLLLDDDDGDGVVEGETLP